jgi:hypothetical protein
MLKVRAKISLISHFILLSLITTRLFSGDVKLADSSSFAWRAISFPSEDKIYQAVLFDSANGWASCGFAADSRLYRLLNGVWQLVPSQNNVYIDKVFGLSPDNFWFGCYNKNDYHHFLRHLDRGTITDYYTPNAD